MNHAIYLIKQARKRAMTPEEKEQERELSRLARQRAKRLERYLGRSAAAAELAGLGGSLGGLGLFALSNKYDKSIPRRTFDALARKMGVKGILLKKTLQPLGYAWDPNALDPRSAGSKGLGAVLSPAEQKITPLAHELGHASGLQRKRWYKKLMMPAYMSGKLGRFLLPAITAPIAAAALEPTGKPKDEAKRLALFGAGTGALISAPMLFEEARASKRAIQHLARLRRLGVKNKLLGLLGLGGAYATYLIPSVVGGAAGALAGGAADVEADYTRYKKPILEELRKKKKLRKPNLSPRKKD